jgi:hypothetical protein
MLDVPRPRLSLSINLMRRRRGLTGLEIRQSIISSCRALETFKHRRHLRDIKITRTNIKKSTDNSDGIRRILYTCRLSACLSSRHRAFLRFCRSGLFRRQLTQLPSPLANVSLDKSSFSRSWATSTPEYACPFCYRVITRPSLPFPAPMKTENSSLHVCPGYRGTSCPKPSEIEWCNANAVMLCFALGMMCVTVGSFVVALLDS